MISSLARTLTRCALIPGLAAALVVAMLAVTAPAQAKKIRSDFFGMHDPQVANGSTPGVKTGAIRLWDTGTAWNQIETAPGVFDWSTVDSAVDTARNAGLRPLLVLGQTPQFHADEPMSQGAYGQGANSNPDLAAWKRYVTTAAKRYGTKVEYQIWNEANVVNYWAGSVSQMARLTATGGKAITKAAGKKATVVAPAFPLRLGSQQKWYKKYWSAKVGGKSVATFVDAVSANPYPLPDQGPEASVPLLKYAKRVLPKVAKRKPMWNTEINYGLAQGGSGESKDISDAKQAAFVGRTIMLNAANGLKRIYWYSWGVPIGNTRLVEDDRTTLTPAGRAWQVSRGWIAGTNMKNCKSAKKGKLKGTYTCTAKKGKRETRRIYWKPAGKSVKVRTHRTTSSWTNLAGNTTKKQGRFTLTVGESPVLVTSRR